MTMTREERQYVGILAACVAVMCLLLAIVGNGDYENAKASEREYCERVDAGAHRDYDDGIDCGVEHD